MAAGAAAVARIELAVQLANNCAPRSFAILIGLCGVLLTALTAAVAVKALSLTGVDDKG